MTGSDSICIQAEGRTLCTGSSGRSTSPIADQHHPVLDGYASAVCDEADLAGSEFGVQSMKAGDTEEGPQYQDPRQLEGPSQPPVAVGPAGPAVAVDAPAQPGASTVHAEKPSQPPNLQAEEATTAATPSEVGSTWRCTTEYLNTHARAARIC